MTTATAGTARPGWNGRRALIAALAVSLVLNLFFIAGALWTRMQSPPAPLTPAQRYERAAGELDLDQQQRAAFIRYVGSARARSEKMRQQIVPLITAAWEEMAKPQPDQAAVADKFSEAARKWRDYQHESTAETVQFLSTLTPDQRQKFVALVRDRRALWLHPHNNGR